jgi:hypothetical protein
METRLTLKPGERGTKKLQEFYGDRLIAVRYRYDPVTRKRMKTAEIIVDEREWIPAQTDSQPHELLQVDIGYHEVELRTKVKEAGGRWDAQKTAWILPRHRIVKLGLQHRIKHE